MLTKESYRNKDRESGEIMIEGNGAIGFYEALYNDNVLAYNVHDGKDGISDLLII